MNATHETMGQKQVHSVVIRAARETVWREMTQSTAPQPAYFGTVFDTRLEPGAKLRYRTEDGSRTIISGAILEVDPPRRMLHTFKFIGMPDAPSRVTWELAEEGAGTRVTITHAELEGFEQPPPRRTAARSASLPVLSGPSPTWDPPSPREPRGSRPGEAPGAATPRPSGARGSCTSGSPVAGATRRSGGSCRAGSR